MTTEESPVEPGPELPARLVETRRRFQQWRSSRPSKSCPSPPELWAIQFEQPRFLRADANADGLVDMSEAIATLGFLFLGDAVPDCLDAADANDSGAVDISDAVHTLTYLFLGGSPPLAPFPGCGTDGTRSELGCWMPPEFCS